MSETYLLLGALLVSLFVMVLSRGALGRWEDHPALRWLRQDPALILLQIVYFVGFPYLLLLGGLIPARFFGLQGQGLDIASLRAAESSLPTALIGQLSDVVLSWFTNFAPFAYQALLVCFIWLFLLWQYLRVTGGQLAFLDSEFRLYHSVVDLFFDVVHWAFYRAACWVLLGQVYAGALGGVGLILVEYLLISWLGNLSPKAQAVLLLRFAIGVSTAVVFIFASNIWLSLALHASLSVLSALMLKHFQLKPRHSRLK